MEKTITRMFADAPAPPPLRRTETCSASATGWLDRGARALKPVLATAGAFVALAFAPPASAGTDQASAEAAVRTVYNQVQARCTPRMPPSFQSISWNSFSNGIGSGVIHDANPALGGSFAADWTSTTSPPQAGWRQVGDWVVRLDFC